MMYCQLERAVALQSIPVERINEVSPSCSLKNIALSACQYLHWRTQSFSISDVVSLEAWGISPGSFSHSNLSTVCLSARSKNLSCRKPSSGPWEEWKASRSTMINDIDCFQNLIMGLCWMKKVGFRCVYMHLMPRSVVRDVMMCVMMWPQFYIILTLIYPFCCVSRTC